MESQKRNTQEMSERDEQVCAHLADLRREYQSGKLEPIDKGVAFAKARAIVDRAIAEQKVERAKVFSQSFPNAI